MITNKENNIFDKQMSKCIKGITILFMFYLHLFGQKESIGNNYFTSIFTGNDSLLIALIPIFTVCVPIFLFIGGYGAYLTRDKKILPKIWGLYKKLFIVFFTVISAVLALGFIAFDIKEYLLNLTGFYYTYCKEWWFFALYIECTILTIIVIKIAQKRIFNINENIFIIVVSILGMLFGYSLKVFLPESAFENFFVTQIYDLALKQPMWFSGYLFAKFDLFNKIYNKFKLFPLLLIPLWAMVYVEQIPESFYMPIIVPIIIYFFTVLLIRTVKPVICVFEFLGNNSTYMWLTHSILIFHVLTKQIYTFHISISCFAIILAIDIPLALALGYLEKGITTAIKKIKAK